MAFVFPGGFLFLSLALRMPVLGDRLDEILDRAADF
jgi:hypothetical protein